MSDSSAKAQTRDRRPRYDLLIIGAGINGAGFARDAAGRGLSIVLCEKDDLAQGTSSRSGKLIHGGLRYLEYYEFRLVREALKERSVMLKKAPHIIWPMRFVLPHSPEQRPAWLVRAGLFLYDHLGGKDDLLPGSRSLDLHTCPEGEALKERSVMLKKAPHIIWPMRFVLPHSPEQRPAWLVRAGLFLYDHLGGKDDLLPGSRSLDLHTCPEGEAIKDEYPKGFKYADCWVDDSRLVVLNALDAARLGAKVYTRAACTKATRLADHWEIELTDTESGDITTLAAKAVINAAGPWVDKVLKGAFDQGGKDRVKLVKGSHIVLPKRYATANSYLLQNDDKRVIFVNPYEGDKLLVGTTDIVYEGDPDKVAIDEEEIDYLLGVVNRYFKIPYTHDDILTSFSGIRPLFDDAQDNPSAVTRDYVFDVSDTNDKAPLLSVFGGKITTYRKLAEHGLEKLAPYFPEMGKTWNETAPLPGGDMPGADFETFLKGLKRDYPWLEETTVTRYARLYGTIARQILGEAKRHADLGEHLGADLYAVEARYLVEHEWARSAADILERRTKLYLVMRDAEVERVEAWVAREVGEPRGVKTDAHADSVATS